MSKRKLKRSRIEFNAGIQLITDNEDTAPTLTKSRRAWSSIKGIREYGGIKKRSVSVGYSESKKIAKTPKNKGKKKKEKLDLSEEEHLQITSTSKTYAEFCGRVKERFGKLRKACKSVDGKKNITENEGITLKRCEQCGDFKGANFLLVCDYCDDAYHMYCLNPPLSEVPEEEEDFICPLCAEQQQKRAKLEEDLDNTYVRIPNIGDKSPPQSTTNTLCTGCGKVERDDNTLMTCEACNKRYHSETCYNEEYKRDKGVYCAKCELHWNQDLRGTQGEYTIKSFFQTVKTIRGQGATRHSDIIQKQANKSRSKFKKPGRYKLPIFPTSREEKGRMRVNLYKALSAKGIIFDDDLNYPDPNAPPSANKASEDQEDIPLIKGADLEVFKAFKQFTREGLYPPVRIINHKIQGACVIATKAIKMNTLICEYVGDVLPRRHVLFSQYDSIMDLLTAIRAQDSLSIFPKSRGNLARFLSGINNYDKGGKAVQNVKSERWNVQGHLRVILIAKKNIKEGEILTYDYNAGLKPQYDTRHFQISKLPQQ